MRRLEHFAFNVADPVAVSDWYESALGFKVLRRGPAPSHTTFLQDPETGVMLEFYGNPEGAIPDYASQHPLTLHIAFATDDTAAEKALVLKAGGSLVSEATTPDGTKLLMMRDPFGLCVQFCQRSPEFFK